jgi:uncharacterized protein involved in exopolysaccharide biosynthesis
MTALLLVTAVAAYLQPARYEAQVKILVRGDRVDSAVTPGAIPASISAEVTDQDLQSEVLVFKSRDLLREAVVACGVEAPKRLWSPVSRLVGTPSVNRVDVVGDAVLFLERAVDVEVVKKSHVLAVVYRDEDPDRAECVIASLSSAYQDKHLQLQRPAGALEFFQREAAGYGHALSELQERRAEFSREAGAASPQLQAELKVRQLQETEAALVGTRTSIAELSQRIAALNESLESSPARQTTQIRTADNAQLMEQLQSSLLSLELKRTGLLSKYEPTYRLVQDVEAQVAQTRSAIAQARQTPVRDETTDNDPTHEWLRAELTQASAELATLRARERSLARMAGTYRRETRDLAERSLQHEDLLRRLKVDEENYLLYLRKQEEARISEALDRQHISNIVVTEPVNVPAAPQSYRAIVLLIGFLCSIAGSLLIAVVVDGWDATLRTPDEVRRFLDLPVLATLSKVDG